MEWSRRRDLAGPSMQRSNEPRIVPASFDFCRANFNGTRRVPRVLSIASGLNPTARLPPSSIAYITLTDRPDS